MNAKTIIKRLGLEPLLPEGGFFAETYRSSRTIPGAAGASERSLATAIYYLLTPETFSALHRLPGDEIYHFYLGDPVELLLLHADGRGETFVLGQDFANGMRLQQVVPGGVWQGSRLMPGSRFALMGTTMAPGFDFQDFEAGAFTALAATHPAFKEHIKQLTR